VLGAAPDVRSVAWSTDGGLLAAGTSTGTVLLWKSAKGGDSPPVELSGHTAAVTAVAFLPARHKLASASLDGNVRLWSLDHPDTDVLVLPAKAWIWALAVTADGDRVVSGGADRMLRTWWTNARPAAAAICRRTARSLTRDELHEYLPAGIDTTPTCPDAAHSAAAPGLSED
jgi:WD40 repeat protein